jgi:hypothetical protein
LKLNKQTKNPLYEIEKVSILGMKKMVKIDPFIETATIQTKTLCLGQGTYKAKIHKSHNDGESGIIICGKSFVNLGESLTFDIRNNGCKINKMLPIKKLISQKPINSMMFSRHYSSVSMHVTSSIQSAIPGFSIMQSASISASTPSPSPSSFEPTHYSSPSPYPSPGPSSSPYPTPIPSSFELSPYPTSQDLPIAHFTTAVVLSVSTNEAYDSQTEQAICSATTTTLDINPSACLYKGTAFIIHNKKHLQAIYSATSSLAISVQTANPAIFFAAASTNLANAASSGLFTANLQSACSAMGIVNAVSSATVIGATASGLTIIQPANSSAIPSSMPTTKPDTNPKINEITNNQIALAVCLTVVCVGITIICLYGLYRHYRPYNKYAETAIEEPVKEEPVKEETENSQLIIVDEIHVSQ